MVESDQVLLQIGAYKNSQSADDYIYPGIVTSLP
jgi:hypothetical protein